jgi:hypothetical protein
MHRMVQAQLVGVDHILVAHPEIVHRMF